MTMFVPSAKFAELATAGSTAGQGVRVTARAMPDASAVSRKVRYVLSDGSVDRMSDTINPNGWQLDEIRRNPVVLFGHKSDEPPIGKLSGLQVVGGKLIGDVEFADAETYAFADTIFRLVKGGYLRAGSVGFVPIEWKFTTDQSRKGGVDFLKQQLLEFSVTPVPANPNALSDARSKGLIPTSHMRALETATATPRLDAARRRFAQMSR
ncbi:HK97 family phage prohead protease [Mesorhizobium loti]|uniref:Prohead serine protease domain-containing protein n=1 Tax=Mesorhizobium loti R88b TaxID=935548 RepID=A0A6M7WQE0_RHILI|nr:HK97 family phage prohead protease [Mesorhizobium loti]QKD04265.1 hypothetical protein EB235_24590 [Mesorhizobium loti R88b]